MAFATPVFLCPSCDEVVQPEQRSGVLRCAKGHRIQKWDQRPIARQVLGSFLFGLIGGSVLLGIGNAILEEARTPAFFVLCLLAGWGLFLWVRSTQLRRTGVAQRLSRQYRASAAGYLIVAALFGVSLVAGAFDPSPPRTAATSLPEQMRMTGAERRKALRHVRTALCRKPGCTIKFKRKDDAI